MIITNETLALFQLTEEDCMTMGDLERNDDCEEYADGACPDGCPFDLNCIIVPLGGSDFMTECSTKELCALEHNVTELACKIICNENDIALGGTAPP